MVIACEDINKYNRAQNILRINSGRETTGKKKSRTNLSQIIF